MPPSGYTKIQSKYIVNFLVSCAESLKQEAMQKNLLPVKALSNECENIMAIITDETQYDIEILVLQTTLNFYKRIIDCSPHDFEQYDQIVKTIAQEIDDAILSIHVPEILRCN